MVTLVDEVEASSEINSHYFNTTKQSGDIIERNVFVYNNFAFPWSGVFISSIIRIDKSINGGEGTTQYYISNDWGDGEYFLKKIVQEWSVETMHFYKDCALYEDKCKIHKGAFDLFVFNSIHNNNGIYSTHRRDSLPSESNIGAYTVLFALSILSIAQKRI